MRDHLHAWFSSVNRTVFMSAAMHIFDHSVHKSLCPCVIEGISIILLIEDIIPGCSRHSIYVFFNPLLLRIDNKFKGSLFEGFFQNPYTFTYFCHHTAIYYFSNWLIIFYFGYFFYIKDYFAFRKIFSTCHIARGIIKLIAWTTSFLEERLDFEITWLMWNANNATMSPPWPKNVHLYLKSCSQFRMREARIL